MQQPDPSFELGAEQDVASAARRVVHDMNNQLMPILGFAELLLMHPKNLEDTERVRRYLMSIRTAANHSRSILARLRAFYEPGQASSTTPGRTLLDSAYVAQEELLVRPLHVLFVDDEPLVLESVSECMRHDGHRVQAMSNGYEALGWLIEHPSSIDVALIDRGMPALGSRLKGAQPGLPVILLTGLADSDAVPPLGVDAVVAKPVTLTSLRDALAHNARPRPNA